MKEFPYGVDFCGNVLKASLFPSLYFESFPDYGGGDPEEGRCASTSECSLVAQLQIFTVVFALLILEAKTSLAVKFFGPLFYGRTFFVRPLVRLGRLRFVP